MSYPVQCIRPSVEEYKEELVCERPCTGSRARLFSPVLWPLQTGRAVTPFNIYSTGQELREETDVGFFRSPKHKPSEKRNHLCNSQKHSPWSACCWPQHSRWPRPLRSAN